MITDVEVVCAFLCYSLALLLELLRPFGKRSRLCSVVGFAALALGVVAHGVLLARRDLLQNERFFNDVGEWFFVLAFGLALSALFLTFVYSKARFGLFLSPVVIATLFVGTQTTERGFSQDAALSWIRFVHATSLLVSTLVSCLGTIMGAMFLVQRNRLKQKIFLIRFPLPTLEWLSRGLRHATNLAVVALGIGVLSGYYLKSVLRTGANGALFDPLVVVGTILLLVAIALRVRRLWRPKSDVNAVDAIVSFLCCLALVAALALAAFFDGGHWRGANEGTKATPRSVNQASVSSNNMPEIPSFRPDSRPLRQVATCVQGAR